MWMNDVEGADNQEHRLGDSYSNSGCLPAQGHRQLFAPEIWKTTGWSKDYRLYEPPRLHFLRFKRQKAEAEAPLIYWLNGFGAILTLTTVFNNQQPKAEVCRGNCKSTFTYILRLYIGLCNEERV